MYRKTQSHYKFDTIEDPYKIKMDSTYVKAVRDEAPDLTLKKLIERVTVAWKAGDATAVPAEKKKSDYHEFLSATLKKLSLSHPETPQVERMSIAQSMWKEIPKETKQKKDANVSTEEVSSKTTEYRAFMSEQMVLLKKEQPELSQPERMKAISELWAAHKKANGGTVSTTKPVARKGKKVTPELEPEEYPVEA